MSVRQKGDTLDPVPWKVMRIILELRSQIPNSGPDVDIMG